MKNRPQPAGVFGRHAAPSTATEKVFPRKVAAHGVVKPSPMKFLLKPLRRLMSSLAGPPKDKLSRGQLVGLYLDTNNNKEDYAARGRGARIRRDGKFSQNRERR